MGQQETISSLEKQLETTSQEKNSLEKELQQQIKTITEEKQSLESSLSKQQETISQKDNGLEKEVQQQVKTITEEKQSLDNSLTQQEETISQEDNGLEQKQLTNNEKGEAISEVKSESAEVEESKEQVKSELVLKSKKLVIVGSLDSMNREKAKSLVQ